MKLCLSPVNVVYIYEVVLLKQSEFLKRFIYTLTVWGLDMSSMYLPFRLLAIFWFSLKYGSHGLILKMLPDQELQHQYAP